MGFGQTMDLIQNISKQRSKKIMGIEPTMDLKSIKK